MQAELCNFHLLCCCSQQLHVWCIVAPVAVNPGEIAKACCLTATTSLSEGGRFVCSRLLEHALQVKQGGLPGFHKFQHFRCRLSTGAYDENMAKSCFILLIV